mmetsp:Transcript_80816/g.177324  ORF Transcript_80816/g.177324 Transcript_80816/m.177324 type:complete len:252 (+) Transcript_80816:654-1409(+)
MLLSSLLLLILLAAFVNPFSLPLLVIIISIFLAACGPLVVGVIVVVIVVVAVFILLALILLLAFDIAHVTALSFLALLVVLLFGGTSAPPPDLGLVFALASASASAFALAFALRSAPALAFALALASALALALASFSPAVLVLVPPAFAPVPRRFTTAPIASLVVDPTARCPTSRSRLAASLSLPRAGLAPAPAPAASPLFRCFEVNGDLLFSFGGCLCDCIGLGHGSNRSDVGLGSQETSLGRMDCDVDH